jgi:DNA-binding MarR family transcriptional regulator
MGDDPTGITTAREPAVRGGAREISVPPARGVPPGLIELLREYRLAADALHASWRHTLGISAYEFQALSNLRARGMGIGELGERLALTSGAMTGLADRLCETGWIERAIDPRDRRRVQLQITAKGRRDMAGVEHRWIEAIEQVVTQLDPGDAETVARVLSTVTKLDDKLARGEA